MTDKREAAMNLANAMCSKCQVAGVSLATGRNGKPYCLQHMPKRKAGVWLVRRKMPVAERLRAERYKVAFTPRDVVVEPRVKVIAVAAAKVPQQYVSHFMLDI